MGEHPSPATEAWPHLNKNLFVPAAPPSDRRASRAERGQQAGDHTGERPARAPPARTTAGRTGRCRRGCRPSSAPAATAQTSPAAPPMAISSRLFRTTRPTCAAARRAQRHPQADLARALRHRIRQHAVDAERGQQQRRQREQRRAASCSAAAGTRRARESDPSCSAVDRLLGIDAPDDALDRVGERQRIALGARDHAPSPRSGSGGAADTPACSARCRVPASRTSATTPTTSLRRAGSG